MKLENFGDLYKYNKELIEDDYNHGQAFVLKTKSRADDNITVRRDSQLGERGLIGGPYCCQLVNSDFISKD